MQEYIILHAASEPGFNKFMLQANDEPERMRWLVETLLEPSKHDYDADQDPSSF